MKYSLILHLSAPMQAWGTESLFQHRGAGTVPSKSAVCGMVCAACGAAKQSQAEADIISGFQRSLMTAIALPDAHGRHGALLRDFHTVQNTRKANNGPAETVVTRRDYRQDSRYLVLLDSEDRAFLEQAAQALRNPCWGIWLGRKCCIPSEPLVQEPVMPSAEAHSSIASRTDHDKLEIYEELPEFQDGAETWRDQPQGFGSPASSGREGRTYTLRAVRHVLPVMEGGEFFDF